MLAFLTGAAGRTRTLPTTFGAAWLCSHSPETVNQLLSELQMRTGAVMGLLPERIGVHGGNGQAPVPDDAVPFRRDMAQVTLLSEFGPTMGDEVCVLSFVTSIPKIAPATRPQTQTNLADLKFSENPCLEGLSLT